jgi:hypothetical protein
MKLLTGKILSVVFLFNLLFFIGVGLVNKVTYQSRGLKQHGYFYYAKASGVQNASFIAEEIEEDESEEGSYKNSKPIPFHIVGLVGNSVGFLHRKFFTRILSLNGYDVSNHTTSKVQFHILNCVFRV